MRRGASILIFSMFTFSAFSQVAEMRWEFDYEIFLKLANDNTYTYDIREAFHVKNAGRGFSSDYVFYRVNPGADYASEVHVADVNNKYFTTLWSALHAKIGGGFIHFSNCIAYSLETGKLDLSSPLMKRPNTGWEPVPMTESFERTRKWKYYVPLSQKNALKEYQEIMNTGGISELNFLPESYIELFKNTSQKDYDYLKATNKRSELAKIDLVKVILGTRYLGHAQITYISNAVLESILAYSSNMLPSVIVFDEFDAATAMTLNANGYKVESMVFNPAVELSVEEEKERREEIERIVEKINQYNRKSFEKRLNTHYTE